MGVDSFLTEGDTLWGVLPLVFLPVSMTIAVLRHRLLDIEVVVSRSLLYLALTGLVLASYSAVVVMLDSVFRTRVAATPAIAALAIAIAFNPVRSVLQRGIERAVFGARRDPVRALSAVGEQLGSGSGLPEMLAVVCEVLRLPAAAIVVHDRVEAAHGELPATCHRTELRHGDQVLGELVVGLRRGESRVSAADAQVLSLLSAPVAAAVHAAALAEEVHRSRARIVSGREEERLPPATGPARRAGPGPHRCRAERGCRPAPAGERPVAQRRPPGPASATRPSARSPTSGAWCTS